MIQINPHESPFAVHDRLKAELTHVEYRILIHFASVVIRLREARPVQPEYQASADAWTSSTYHTLWLIGADPDSRIRDVIVTLDKAPTPFLRSLVGRSRGAESRSKAPRATADG